AGRRAEEQLRPRDLAQPGDAAAGADRVHPLQRGKALGAANGAGGRGKGLAIVVDADVSARVPDAAADQAVRVRAGPPRDGGVDLSGRPVAAILVEIAA